MTVLYAGPGGNDGNSGLTWALRKLTLTGAEAVGLAAGDVVYVGPGVYREWLICTSSGGNVYNAGTVTVTNGSTTVTGAGTAFLANVAIADMFHNRLFASGNDGVANGTATFTSAAGNFQASMVGKMIQVNARGAYRIGAVASANSITLTDPHGLGWPAAGANLVYSVISGEGPYEIASVTDNNNFELVRPWCGPTLAGLAYITYRPIRYIADVTGEHTDGVGGAVRVTGSDNDVTPARTHIIFVDARNYRLFRGFRFDLNEFYAIQVTTGIHLTVEDCSFTSIGWWGFVTWSGSQGITFRRCLFFVNKVPLYFYTDPAVDDTGHVVENCWFVGGHESNLVIRKIGGMTIKNCSFMAGLRAILFDQLPNLGQTLVVNNCFVAGLYIGFIGSGVGGDFTENYNSISNTDFARQNVTVGANSNTYPPLLEMPLFRDGLKFPWWAGELSEWSQVRAIAGTFEACGDLCGFVRPVISAKKSWGALQFTDMERDTGTVFAGVSSMKINDAGRVQLKVPTTNRRYTVRVWVQREANYAGTNPQLIIKQPGQADRIVTDAGAASAWNLLQDSFTPAALPPYLFIELVSNNTAAAGNYATYFDRLTVRGSPLDTGEMEQWLWDRQPMENYGKVTPVVKKSVQGDEIFVEVNTQGDLKRVAP